MGENFLKKKKSYRNTIRVSNSLDPDRARHYVGPDLGPNCSQGLQQMTIVPISSERVNLLP